MKLSLIRRFLYLVNLTLAIVVIGCGTPSMEPTATTYPTLRETATKTSAPTNSPTISPSASSVPTSTQTPLPTQTVTPTPYPTSAKVKESGKPVVIPADPSTAEITITEIHMISHRNGWAMDDSGKRVRVLRTRDGGRTWRDVTPHYESWSPYTIPSNTNQFIIDEFVPRLGNGAFLDSQRAWISTKYGQEEFDFRMAEAGRILLSTQDGGQSWHMVLLPEDHVSGQANLSFVDPLHGWLNIYPRAGLGHKALYRTKNGGETWELLYSGPTIARSPLHVTFGDAQTVLMAFPFVGMSYNPYLSWSRSGGETWEDAQRLNIPQDSGIDLSLSSVGCGTEYPHLFSDQRGFVMVECRITIEEKFKYRSFLYRTDDGGQTWETNPAPTGRLYLLTPDVGWILGKDIYRTTDGGQTWRKVNTVSWEGQFSFVDPLHGWAVAKDEGETALVTTEDGGYSWEIIDPRLVP